MPFIRDYEILLHKSSNYISKITCNNNLEISNLSCKGNLISKSTLLPGKFSFLDLHFDINDKNSIYGIVNDKKGSLIYFYINEKIIVKNTFLKYDKNLYTIKFIYINKNKDNVNVLYYLIDNSNPKNCKLIHYNYADNTFIKNTVANISYDILTNFNVIFDDNFMYIFYLNIINNHSELFFNKFDLSNRTWSTPIQITNTKKQKVYLSVIQDSKKIFHITFSENNMSKYHCMYLKLILQNSKIFIKNYVTIDNTITCTFPSITKYNNKIYIHWIEYDDLYATYSTDNGSTWSCVFSPTKEKDFTFLRCYYKNDSKNFINNSILFCKENSLNPVNIFQT